MFNWFHVGLYLSFELSWLSNVLLFFLLWKVIPHDTELLIYIPTGHVFIFVFQSLPLSFAEYFVTGLSTPRFPLFRELIVWIYHYRSLRLKWTTSCVYNVLPIYLNNLVFLLLGLIEWFNFLFKKLILRFLVILTNFNLLSIILYLFDNLRFWVEWKFRDWGRRLLKFDYRRMSRLVFGVL